MIPFFRAQIVAGDRVANAPLLQGLEEGDFKLVLSSPLAISIIGLNEASDNRLAFTSDAPDWIASIEERIKSVLIDAQNVLDRSQKEAELVVIGTAALHAFLQSNVTGPPLEWNPKQQLGLAELSSSSQETIRRELIASLSIDGVAAYKLTPCIELFCLARAVLNHPFEGSEWKAIPWARLRCNFWHQNLLEEAASSLQVEIYNNLIHLDHLVLSTESTFSPKSQVLFLLERAAIHTYYGLDTKAHDDLERARKMNGFEYILTGRLGKRTKFQETNLSQLVVLAKSVSPRGMDSEPAPGPLKSEDENVESSIPKNIDLNDDTLLEAIDFSKPDAQVPAQEELLPPPLAALDPANQPPLEPLDCIILLSLASSITNTSPQHGLTREETLPYATRVLEGGSSNWQIYTQALLVRSRVEGYRSRTVERGVLQLQALVDQVIAETSTSPPPEASGAATITSPNLPTFLPRPKASETAPAPERLQYIHQLIPPTRWNLEAELAARWVSLGGLRTALEIYERLQMWAEVALCWAATDREDKARRTVRHQLFNVTTGNSAFAANGDEESEEYLGQEREPLPLDAPRLFCILGDIDKAPEFYERAWAVSNNRYARAQRSLGKFYHSTHELSKADEAYSKSLLINPQNHASWFALGCVRLELEHWQAAVAAFSRAVQIEDQDAETWSNLAAALLRLPPNEAPLHPASSEDLEISSPSPRPASKDYKHEAFVALKRAAVLRRDSYRIWQNVLNVSVSLIPPPYADIVIAQQRLIELRGSVEGEGCVDAEVMDGLLAHVIQEFPPKRVPNGHELAMEAKDVEQHSHRYGLERMFIDLVQKHVIPLITHSRRLWKFVARFSLHLNRPSSALEAYEKAWRVTLNRPGWDDGTGPSTSTFTDAVGGSGSKALGTVWDDVVDATIELVDAYENLGEKEVTEGLKAGSGELVCKNWKYKGKMAIRSVTGRRLKVGLDDIGRLQDRLEELNAG